MRSLIEFGLRQHVLMNLLFIGLILMSTVVLRDIPIDRFPNLPFGEAHVLVRYPGATAGEVERLVTQKLEDALRGMDQLEYVRTTTTPGQSELFLKFDDDTDYDHLYDQARLRLLAVQNQMPVVNGKSLFMRMDKLEADAWLPVVQLSLIASNSARPLADRQLFLLAKDLRDRLETIPGVKRISIEGNRPEQFMVELDQTLLERHRVTYGEVVQALADAGVAPPAGTVDTIQGERLFRVDARYRSRDDVMSVLVRRDGEGSLLTVGELCRQSFSGEQAIEQGLMITSNGHRALMCKVLKDSRASTIKVKNQVVAIANQFLAEHKDAGLELIYSADSAVRIADFIGVLVGNLIGGIILVTIALLCFLTWRTALLTLSGVVFAVMVALLYFWITGNSLNELTVVGLVLVSGMLVGDAIVVVDNIQRHLEEGKSISDAVVGGTEEVFWPVVNAALTTIASFLPLLMMTGLVGDFFSLLPIAVSVALIGSLFECMLMLPLHAVTLDRLLGPEKKTGQRIDGSEGYLLRRGIVGLLARFYDRVLRWNLRHPFQVMMYVALMFLLTAAVLIQSRFAPEWGQRPILKLAFFPNDASILNVAVRMPPQATQEQTSAMLVAIEKTLIDMGPGKIANANGLAGMIMDSYYKPVWGHQYGFIFIELPSLDKRTADSTAILTEVRSTLEERFERDGVALEINQQSDGPPVGLPVTIRVSGRNTQSVEALARDLKPYLQELANAARLKGLIDLNDDASRRIQQISFTPHWQALSQYHLGQRQVMDFIAGAVDGAYVGEFRLSDEDIPLRVRLDRRLLDDPSYLLQVPIINEANGRQVHVGDVARIEAELAPASLVRRDFQRTITITGNFVADSPLAPSHVSDVATAWVKEHAHLYPGASIAFGGEAESTSKSYASLVQALLLAIFIIYLLLATQFRSYSQPLLILSNVIFAFIGVFLVLGLFGIGLMALPEGLIRPERGVFTVQSFIAIVGLTGVVVNDAIVLIDFINRRRTEGLSLHEALVTAGHQRMRAILLTSITTIAGLTTMAIGIPEFSIAWSPLATCFIAGLMMSTVMTLLVVPVMYLLLERLKGNRESMQGVA
jgi:multidrug efflux pump subunit AcrB